MSLTTLMSVSELVLQDSVPEYCRSILCQALACSFEQRLWGFGANAQSKPKGDNNEMKTFMKSYFQFQLKSALYTGSMAPVDFSGAVFTCMHFQKIALICSFAISNYSSEGIPSLMTWLMQIFARPKKTHKTRTGCIRGWQNSRGHKRWISWTKWVNSHGHFWWIFMDTFLNSNDKSYTIIKQ